MLPKFIKDGYFGDFPYIMTEYVEYSLQDYIKLDEYPGKTSLSMICI
jgi:hypothetical protein